MTTLLAGVSLLLLSPQEGRGEWVRVGENARSITYVDTSIRRSGDTATYWVMFDYRAIQESPRSGRRYLSEKAQHETECRSERDRAVYFSWHDEQMGNGNVVYTGNMPTNWEPTSAPDSIGNALWNFVCNQEDASYRVIEEALLDTSKKMNRQLPMMVDAETRLDTTVCAGKELFYRYTMVNLALDDIVKLDFLRKAREMLVGNVCNNISMKLMLKASVKYSYIYMDKNGREIATIRIDRASCGK